jgi:hypothetical protein
MVALAFPLDIHLDATQVGISHGHCCFCLLDLSLEVLRVKLSQELPRFNLLMVFDSDSQNDAPHMGTDGDDIADDIGVIGVDSWVRKYCHCSTP